MGLKGNNPNPVKAREQSLKSRREAFQAKAQLPFLLQENKLLRELLINAGLAHQLPSASELIQVRGEPHPHYESQHK